MIFFSSVVLLWLLLIGELQANIKCKTTDYNYVPNNISKYS